ncbi:LPS export ABC transporter periplasmic protein LptC [Mucilaginibacter ximonensis]|uniref:LPS export ABC transporter periplasmic protein LptC n=1 Tax=Mucilaginibacter ximonensis TaxID=538021 RepID=A0ABW5YGN8_9SPHI
MMHSRLKRFIPFVFPALLFGVLLLSACENDLKKIKEVSAKYTSAPVDTIRGAEIIYSDSAIVKGKMVTPMMIQYNISDPFWMMPKGVKIIFYDINTQEDGNIVADSGVYHTVVQKIEFYHHVVYTTAKGDVFKSDELIWDQQKKIMYSNKPVQIITATGDILNGINFTSDDKLRNPQMTQSTGSFNVNDMPTGDQSAGGQSPANQPPVNQVPTLTTPPVNQQQITTPPVNQPAGPAMPKKAPASFQKAPVIPKRNK